MSENKGLWIPGEILENPELNTNEKLVLALVLPMTFDGPCNAGNDYLAKRIGITDQTVSNVLNNLHLKGYLRLFLDHPGGNKRYIYSYIVGSTLYKYLGEPIQKIDTPLYKNFVEVYKEVVEPLENLYRPSIKSLDRLYKNFVFIYKDENNIEGNRENNIEGKEEEKRKGADAPATEPDKDLEEPKDPGQSPTPTPKVPARPPSPPKPTVEDRREDFRQQLLVYHEKNPDKYEPVMYKAFLNYWSESDGKKMRWEKEPVFEIPNRLSTWHQRDQNPKNGNGNKNGRNGTNQSTSGRVEPQPGRRFGNWK